ncbi:hypothetical protein QTO34_018406 [Cnephaeus nilssonii]|uniref:Calcium-activated chloride channel N-terminal domain-containing protein n=1 Tax=Cnephaeus nilssonii TaxID=3371016 RepID=A0AA40HYU3_CNENI|nr:hypothetical protein QTO34_018406 [Eptesicus nilssonii]
MPFALYKNIPIKNKLTSKLFKSSVFILVLHLLEGALSNSLIQLNNNGYEGIVIAIDPNVPEDETLIQEIKKQIQKDGVWRENQLYHQEESGAGEL